MMMLNLSQYFQTNIYYEIDFLVFLKDKKLII